MRAFKKSLALVFMLSAPALMFAGPVTMFSTGFVLPESISLAPAGFGLPAGSLVVTDAGGATGSTSAIYSVAPGGGSPSLLASGPISLLDNGIFAPSSFGSLGGDYLAFGFTNSTASFATISALSSASGTLANVYTASSPAVFQGSAVLAPSGYGSVAGDILMTFDAPGSLGVDSLSPTGTVSTFATISNFTVTGFGAAFAPAGFVPGTTSSVLLVSDATSGQIDWIDSSGNVHLFTTVPLMANQTGLRQIAFAPAGFVRFAGDLFVSVTGSQAGSVDVINSAGQLVGILSQGTVAAPFDPRGLYFLSNTDLWWPTRILPYSTHPRRRSPRYLSRAPPGW